MADKRFNLVFDVDANIGPIKNAVSGLQGALNKINIPDSFKKNLESTFTKLNNEIENFEAIASKGFTNMADIGKAEKSFGKITDLLSKLRVQTSQLKGIDPNKFLPQENVKKVQELQKAWGKLKEQIEKGTGNSAEIAKQTQELERQKKAADDLQTSYDSLKAKNKSLGKSRSTLTDDLEAARNRAKEVVAEMTKIEGQKGGKTSAQYKDLSNELSTLNATIKINEQEFARLNNTIQRNEAQLAGYKTELKTTKGTIKDIEGTIEALRASAQQTPEGFNELRQQLAELKGVDISEIPTDIDQIGEEIASLNVEQLKKLREDFGLAETAAQGLEDPLHAAADALGDVVQQGAGINQRAQEMEQLANQVKQFFSIGNTVQLFKRSIKSAFDTIKELDAVMTQTAVVTKYTVADMWSQLPEYTKRANELGVSVKGAYEAATLYYQQGLDTNEVIGVSNETLKMAKIAAIDYATATDYMTSALRGFNMEVNEESARKINDIYSQLAAKTAADTEEISIAMSKTAPLAHNAGMEIETTAALLSQMIETTREAPETLGTAMKTVIARFQELKKDPALIEPVDGEIVDANKVETALRTIGVSLRDVNGQFRDLDDVFLEISQKWNSLDTNTQRYIATIAAGSRQQSRFIAMMANYSRTTELVAMANNAAGASQEQFEKTLDSMQSKLDRLRNAWNEYTMGLANNKIIKIVVDLLTGFLNTVNKISTTLSGEKGIFKSFFDIAFLIGGIKLARAVFNGFFGWLIKDSKIKGSLAGKSTGEGFSASLQKVLSASKKIFTKSTWVGVNDIITSKDVAEAKNRLDGIRSTIEKTKNDLENRPPNLFADLKSATQEYQAALNGIGKTLTLTNAQQAISNNLQSIGVAEGIANAAAVGGLTKEKMLEIQATMIANGLSQEEINKRMANIASIYAESGAQEASNTQQRLGIITRLQNIAVLLFGSKAARADAMAKLGMAAADSTATTAQTALNAAVAAFPIGWLLAGLAAIIALIALLVSHAKKVSLEGRMKAAEESTKRAKEAAEEAKNAYDQLLNDKSGYDETQQALKDLTYGTQEWKKALIEANQQVLTLLRTYPELMQYLGKGEYGQLTISEEGWQAAIDAQQKVVIRAQGAVAQSQLKQNRLQKEALDKDLEKNFQYTSDTSKRRSGHDTQTRQAERGSQSTAYASRERGSTTTTIDSKTQKAVEDLVAKNLSAGELDKELENLANNSRWSKKELESAAQAVLEYNNAVDQNQLEMQNAAKAFLTSALTTENMDQVGQDVAENIINTFSDNLVKTSEAEINSLSQEIKSSKDKRNELASELGVILGGNVENQLNQLYAALSGQTLEEVKAMKLSSDQLAKEIAKYQNSENISKKMNDFAESFTKLGKETQKQVNLAMSEGTDYIVGMAGEIDTTNFTAEFGSLADYIAEKAAEAAVSNLTEAEEEAIKIVYGSVDKYKAAYAEAIRKGEGEIEKATQTLRDSGIIGDNESFGTGLSAGAISGLTSHLMEVFEVSGTVAARTLADNIQATLDKIKIKDPEQALEFATALNSIDWSSTESVEGLSDRLEQLVKDGAMSEDEVDDLEKQIVELAKAARTVDLEKVAEQIKSLSKIQYNIGKGEQDSNFSEEDYKALIEAGVASAGDFVYNLATDSWTYIAGSMDDLSEAIGNNTDALLDLDNLRSGVRSSEAAKEVSKRYEGINTSSSGQLIMAIQSYMKKAGADNKLVSQDWLAKNVNDIDTLLAKWNEILGEAQALEVRRTQADQVEAQGQQIQLQTNTTQENAQLAIGGNQNAIAALQVQAQAAGVAKDVYNELTTAIRENDGAKKEAAIQTLAGVTAAYQEAQAWELDTEQLGFYAKQLQLAYPGMAEDAAARIALANTLLNTGLGEIMSSYDNWVGLIDESTGLIKVETNEDAEAFNNLKKSVSKMVGASEDLSDAFWQNAENIDAVKRAAEGDLEAIEDLQKAASKDFLMNLDIVAEDETARAAIEDFYKYLDGIDLPQLEAGVQWDGTGATKFINAFNDMAQQANLSAEQIQEAAKRMGFDAEVTYVKQTRKLPVYEQTETITENQDGSRTIKSGTPVITDYAEVEGYFPVVKTLTSIGSGGGGVSVNNKKAGATNAEKASGGNKSGGGESSKKDEKWENPYDWLYNLTQKINAELRTREKLERRYQRLLKTYAGSGAELKKITDQELASLEKRKKLEEQMIELRRKELKEYLAANAALAQYASINWELEVVTINWDKINAVTGKEQGEQIEKYVDKLEELIESVKDAEDEIEDIEDDIVDLKERGRDQYRDLEDRVLDALISEQQEMIDEQERIYNAINDAATSLTDAISKNIQKIRQDRQNEETEASLAEKERRLAYLRQDTTGSNALEIKKLEDDLNKEKQSYTDTLIDQSLNELKEQNDAAAEQRNKQIELAQSTLDWQEKIGYWTDEATRIVREGLGPNGVMSENTRLYQLLYAQEGADGMSNASKEWWNQELSNTIHEAFVYLENILGGTGGSQSPENRDIMAEMIAQSNKGKGANANMTTLGKLEEERNQKIRDEGLQDVYPETNMVGSYNSGKNSYNPSTDKDVDWMGEIDKEINQAEPNWSNAFYYAGKRDAKIESEAVDPNYASDWTFDIVFDRWYANTKGKKFKNGGLADFTGPAWLDGTKSKPEMVLNARDTENFIQLKDVLAGLRSNLVGANDSQGDWYFDIDVNVDEIANDYDVDRMVERVKQSIYNETTYRNVNAINFLK